MESIVSGLEQVVGDIDCRHPTGEGNFQDPLDVAGGNSEGQVILALYQGVVAVLPGDILGAHGWHGDCDCVVQAILEIEVLLELTGPCNYSKSQINTSLLSVRFVNHN